MRSRAARWTFVTLAWIALVAAGWFLFNSHKQIVAASAVVRAVDLRAHEADASLNEARVGQQAYVATGQGAAFWVPKVAATIDAVTAAVKALRESAQSDGARSELDEVAAAIGDFRDVDKRARDYIRAGQTLMAGDVIYTEGGQAIAGATRHLEAARQAERQAFDTHEAAMRKQQAEAIGGAAALAALVTLLLAPLGRSADESGSTTLSLSVTPDRSMARGATPGVDADEGIVSHARPVDAPAPSKPASIAAASPSPSTPPRHSVVLKAAADLATDFGRARDADELQRLLARAADVIDASGLIVWMGDTSGGDLRAVLSHGYSKQVLAKIPTVPRNADNVAATAYRTGALQILPRKPGSKVGAIVAPILGADGCIGALSAEINDGGEGSEAVQALSAIVAAHLASVLAVSTANSHAMPEPRAAAQG